MASSTVTLPTGRRSKMKPIETTERDIPGYGHAFAVRRDTSPGKSTMPAL